jgi:hypothetical protein
VTPAATVSGSAPTSLRLPDSPRSSSISP